MPGLNPYPSSVQPGIPKQPMIPRGWIIKSFREVLISINRPLKLIDNKKYILITIKRNRNGIVERGVFLGKDILVKSQFELKAGDFVISKRQIVHGACGILPKELNNSIVSNEYCVFQSKSKDLDLNYFSHYTHSIYFQQTCFYSSIGIVVEKMVFKVDMWLKCKFPLPPLPEQKKIAAILSTWDRAIDKLEALIEAKERRKKGLMQLLLTGKKRLKGFSNNWKNIEIENCCKYSPRPIPKPQKKYLALGIRSHCKGLFHKPIQTL